MLNVLAKPLTRIAERYIPNALFFAIALTFLVAVLCLTLTDVGPTELVMGWGDSLDDLLAFIAQMCLILLLGFTLAHTRPMRALLRAASRLPKTPMQCYGMITFTTGALSLLNWGLGLIAGALMAIELARVSRERGRPLHYPLIVAGAYSGWVVFHMGYSGSAPLAAASADGIYKDVPGGAVPVTETTFSTWNMVAAVIALLVVTFVIARLAPKNAWEVVEAPESVVHEEVPIETGPKANTLTQDRTPADFVDEWRVPTLATGVALAIYLLIHFQKSGATVTFDIVNWTFLALVLLFVGNIKELTALVKAGGRTVGDILIQFPFYAGIIGMMTISGLADKLSNFFVSVSTPETLGFFCFLSAGILNMAIPSGGGQFAVQGPIFADAAAKLGVDQSVVIMGIAYGDQWTNMIQPFWAIPLLAVAGLRVRQIMGYTTITLIVSGVVFASTMLIVGSG